MTQWGRPTDICRMRHAELDLQSRKISFFPSSSLRHKISSLQLQRRA